MAVRGRVSFPRHDPRGLHGYCNSLGAVQAVRGVVQAPAQPQAEALGGPHPSVWVPSFVVGVLRGLGAALGRDGDEGFGGGARWHWRRGLLVIGRVGDSWKDRQTEVIFIVTRVN